MNEYRKLKDRHQQEFNALPMGFAFGNEQFSKMMVGWGSIHSRTLTKSIPSGRAATSRRKI